MTSPSASSSAAAASIRRNSFAPASMHSSVASAIAGSGSAISPRVPDSGSNNARLPACHP